MGFGRQGASAIWRRSDLLWTRAEPFDSLRVIEGSTARRKAVRVHDKVNLDQP